MSSECKYTQDDEKRSLYSHTDRMLRQSARKASPDAQKPRSSSTSRKISEKSSEATSHIPEFKANSHPPTAKKVIPREALPPQNHIGVEGEFEDESSSNLSSDEVRRQYERDYQHVLAEMHKYQQEQRQALREARQQTSLATQMPSSIEKTPVPAADSKSITTGAAVLSTDQPHTKATMDTMGTPAQNRHVPASDATDVNARPRSTSIPSRDVPMPPCAAVLGHDGTQPCFCEGQSADNIGGASHGQADMGNPASSGVGSSTQDRNEDGGGGSQDSKLTGMPHIEADDRKTQRNETGEAADAKSEDRSPTMPQETLEGSKDVSAGEESRRMGRRGKGHEDENGADSAFHTPIAASSKSFSQGFEAGATRVGVAGGRGGLGSDSKQDGWRVEQTGRGSAATEDGQQGKDADLSGGFDVVRGASGSGGRRDGMRAIAARNAAGFTVAPASGSDDVGGAVRSNDAGGGGEAAAHVASVATDQKGAMASDHGLGGSSAGGHDAARISDAIGTGPGAARASDAAGATDNATKAADKSKLVVAADGEAMPVKTLAETPALSTAVSQLDATSTHAPAAQSGAKPAEAPAPAAAPAVPPAAGAGSGEMERRAKISARGTGVGAVPSAAPALAEAEVGKKDKEDKKDTNMRIVAADGEVMPISKHAEETQSGSLASIPASEALPRAASPETAKTAGGASGQVPNQARSGDSSSVSAASHDTRKQGETQGSSTKPGVAEDHTNDNLVIATNQKKVSSDKAKTRQRPQTASPIDAGTAAGAKPKAVETGAEAGKNSMANTVLLHTPAPSPQYTADLTPETSGASLPTAAPNVAHEASKTPPQESAHAATSSSQPLTSTPVHVPGQPPTQATIHSPASIPAQTSIDPSHQASAHAPEQAPLQSSLQPTTQASAQTPSDAVMETSLHTAVQPPIQAPEVVSAVVERIVDRIVAIAAQKAARHARELEGEVLSEDEIPGMKAPERGKFVRKNFPKVIPSERRVHDELDEVAQGDRGEEKDKEKPRWGGVRDAGRDAGTGAEKSSLRVNATGNDSAATTVRGRERPRAAYGLDESSDHSSHDGNGSGNNDRRIEGAISRPYNIHAVDDTATISSTSSTRSTSPAPEISSPHTTAHAGRRPRASSLDRAIARAIANALHEATATTAAARGIDARAERLVDTPIGSGSSQTVASSGDNTSAGGASIGVAGSDHGDIVGSSGHPAGRDTSLAAETATKSSATLSTHAPVSTPDATPMQGHADPVDTTSPGTGPDRVSTTYLQGADNGRATTHTLSSSGSTDGFSHDAKAARPEAADKTSSVTTKAAATRPHSAIDASVAASAAPVPAVAAASRSAGNREPHDASLAPAVPTLDNPATTRGGQADGAQNATHAGVAVRDSANDTSSTPSIAANEEAGAASMAAPMPVPMTTNVASGAHGSTTTEATMHTMSADTAEPSSHPEAHAQTEATKEMRDVEPSRRDDRVRTGNSFVPYAATQNTVKTMDIMNANNVNNANVINPTTFAGTQQRGGSKPLDGAVKASADVVSGEHAKPSGLPRSVDVDLEDEEIRAMEVLDGASPVASHISYTRGKDALIAESRQKDESRVQGSAVGSRRNGVEREEGNKRRPESRGEVGAIDEDVHRGDVARKREGGKAGTQIARTKEDGKAGGWTRKETREQEQEQEWKSEDGRHDADLKEETGSAGGRVLGAQAEEAQSTRDRGREEEKKGDLRSKHVARDSSSSGAGKQASMDVKKQQKAADNSAGRGRTTSSLANAVAETATEARPQAGPQGESEEIAEVITPAAAAVSAPAPRSGSITAGAGARSRSSTPSSTAASSRPIKAGASVEAGDEDSAADSGADESGEGAADHLDRSGMTCGGDVGGKCIYGGDHPATLGIDGVYHSELGAIIRGGRVRGVRTRGRIRGPRVGGERQMKIEEEWSGVGEEMKTREQVDEDEEVDAEAENVGNAMPDNLTSMPVHEDVENPINTSKRSIGGRWGYEEGAFGRIILDEVVDYVNRMTGLGWLLTKEPYEWYEEEVEEPSEMDENAKVEAQEPQMQEAEVIQKTDGERAAGAEEEVGDEHEMPEVHRSAEELNLGGKKEALGQGARANQGVMGNGDELVEENDETIASPNSWAKQSPRESASSGIGNSRRKEEWELLEEKEEEEDMKRDEHRGEKRIASESFALNMLHSVVDGVKKGVQTILSVDDESPSRVDAIGDMEEDGVGGKGAAADVEAEEEEKAEAAQAEVLEPDGTMRDLDKHEGTAGAEIAEIAEEEEVDREEDMAEEDVRGEKNLSEPLLYRLGFRPYQTREFDYTIYDVLKRMVASPSTFARDAVEEARKAVPETVVTMLRDGTTGKVVFGVWQLLVGLMGMVMSTMYRMFNMFSFILGNGAWIAESILRFPMTFPENIMKLASWLLSFPINIGRRVLDAMADGIDALSESAPVRVIEWTVLKFVKVLLMLGIVRRENEGDEDADEEEIENEVHENDAGEEKVDDLSWEGPEEEEGDAIGAEGEGVGEDMVDSLFTAAAARASAAIAAASRLTRAGDGDGAGKGSQGDGGVDRRQAWRRKKEQYAE